MRVATSERRSGRTRANRISLDIVRLLQCFSAVTTTRLPLSRQTRSFADGAHWIDVMQLREKHLVRKCEHDDGRKLTRHTASAVLSGERNVISEIHPFLPT